MPIQDASRAPPNRNVGVGSRHNRGVGIQAASFHFCCEIENAKDLHAVRRYRVFIVNDSDVAKAKRLDQGLHDFVVRDRAVSFG